MTLVADLERIAAAVARYAPEGGALSAVLPAEPTPGLRGYLCAFETEAGGRSWLVVDDEGEARVDRRDIRDVVAIAALCEIAEESAVGGDLDELLSQLVALRLTENPEGIEEAEEAALELERTIGAPPRLATPAHLDAIGAATRRLEQALGEVTASPFGAAMQQAMAVVGDLESDVLGGYKLELS